jgi:hypothetical protein
MYTLKIITVSQLLGISVGFCHNDGKDQVCEEEMVVSSRRRYMLRSRQFLELERKRLLR